MPRTKRSFAEVPDAVQNTESSSTASGSKRRRSHGLATSATSTSRSPYCDDRSSTISNVAPPSETSALSHPVFSAYGDQNPHPYAFGSVGDPDDATAFSHHRLNDPLPEFNMGDYPEMTENEDHLLRDVATIFRSDFVPPDVPWSSFNAALPSQASPTLALPHDMVPSPGGHTTQLLDSSEFFQPGNYSVTTPYSFSEPGGQVDSAYSSGAGPTHRTRSIKSNYDPPRLPMLPPGFPIRGLDVTSTQRNFDGPADHPLPFVRESFSSSRPHDEAMLQKREAIQQKGRTENNQGSTQGEVPASRPYHCGECDRSFKNQSDLKKDRLRHEKPFRCLELGCKSTGFSTRNDLDRHRKSVHGIALQNDRDKSFRCVMEKCSKAGKIWPRADNFMQHCRRQHPDEELEDLLKRSVLSSLGDEALDHKDSTIANTFSNDSDKKMAGMQSSMKVVGKDTGADVVGSDNVVECAATSAKKYANKMNRPKYEYSDAAGSIAPQSSSFVDPAIVQENDDASGQMDCQPGNINTLDREQYESQRLLNIDLNPTKRSNIEDDRAPPCHTSSMEEDQMQEEPMSAHINDQEAKDCNNRSRKMKSDSHRDRTLDAMHDFSGKAGSADLRNANFVTSASLEAVRPHHSAQAPNEDFPVEENAMANGDPDSCTTQKPGSPFSNAKSPSPANGIQKQDRQWTPIALNKLLCTLAPNCNSISQSDIQTILHEDIPLKVQQELQSLTTQLFEKIGAAVTVAQKGPKDRVVLNLEDEKSEGSLSVSTPETNTETPWKCLQCGKFKSDHNKLRKHQLRHMRAYTCTADKLCKQTFGSKSDWKRHERTLHDDVTFEQIWWCPLTFPESWVQAQEAKRLREGGQESYETESIEVNGERKWANRRWKRCVEAGVPNSSLCQCVLYTEKDFDDHLHMSHDLHEPSRPTSTRRKAEREWNIYETAVAQRKHIKRRAKIGRNGIGSFWCGFCNKVVEIDENLRGMKAWDERYNHIDKVHFKANKAKIDQVGENAQKSGTSEDGAKKQAGKGDDGDITNKDLNWVVLGEGHTKAWYIHLETDRQPGKFLDQDETGSQRTASPDSQSLPPPAPSPPEESFTAAPILHEDENTTPLPPSTDLGLPMHDLSLKSQSRPQPQPTSTSTSTSTNPATRQTKSRSKTEKKPVQTQHLRQWSCCSCDHTHSKRTCDYCMSCGHKRCVGCGHTT